MTVANEHWQRAACAHRERRARRARRGSAGAATRPCWRWILSRSRRGIRSACFAHGRTCTWTLRCIVYPKPSQRGLPPPPLETDTGGAQDTTRGDEDFAGLRAFHPGDSPRRIAWKAYAREQGLHVKVYAGTAVTSHSFDWEALHGPRRRSAAVAAMSLDRGCSRGRSRIRPATAGTGDRAERRSRSSAAMPDSAGAVRRAGGS